MASRVTWPFERPFHFLFLSCTLILAQGAILTSLSIRSTNSYMQINPRTARSFAKFSVRKIESPCGLRDGKSSPQVRHSRVAGEVPERSLDLLERCHLTQGAFWILHPDSVVGSATFTDAPLSSASTGFILQVFFNQIKAQKLQINKVQFLPFRN